MVLVLDLVLVVLLDPATGFVVDLIVFELVIESGFVLPLLVVVPLTVELGFDFTVDDDMGFEVGLLV